MQIGSQAIDLSQQFSELTHHKKLSKHRENCTVKWSKQSTLISGSWHSIGLGLSGRVLHTYNLTCTGVNPIHYFQWGTYRDDPTSRLSHLSTFSSYLTAIIGENLLLSFFSFNFKLKILQSFISSQLTTCFGHNSQKTSIAPLQCKENLLYRKTLQNCSGCRVDNTLLTLADLFRSTSNVSLSTPFHTKF